MNIGESGPWTKPIEVARLVTRELWLLGMPPVFQNMVETTPAADRLRWRARSMMVFRSCARNQEKNADKKTGPERNAKSPVV